MSAGWFWQPSGIAEVFDLVGALSDPARLDGLGVTPLVSAVEREVWSASWLDGDRLAISAGETDQSGPYGVWSLAARDWTFLATIEYPIGVMVPVGDRLLCLYGHPRLLDPATSAVMVMASLARSGCRGPGTRASRGCH